MEPKFELLRLISEEFGFELCSVHIVITRRRKNREQNLV